jgi:hypothetical protein
MKIPAINARLALLDWPNFPVPVDLGKGDGWFDMAARLECRLQAVNEKIWSKKAC